MDNPITSALAFLILTASCDVGRLVLYASSIRSISTNLAI